MGHMADYSKGECLRVAKLLQGRIDAGDVERLKRRSVPVARHGWNSPDDATP
jgi:hypothetical protein